jgi:hypothetical protein
MYKGRFSRRMRLASEERGSTLVFVALAMAVLLGVSAIAIDGGRLFVIRSQLQKTANAAVLSGAQELTHTVEAVDHVVDTVLREHGEWEHKAGAVIELGQRVSVELVREVPLGLAQVLGFRSAPVHAHAAAEIQTMGEAIGAAPLGIDERIPLEYGREYKLKVDQTEVSYGNFGILALGGGGAKTYEQNLKNGYQDALQIGDIVETQTGNIAGKTREGVKLRIDQCPYPEGETHHRDCPRVLLVPVYRPLTMGGNQIKEVEITGFAYFYITQPMSSNDTSITGKFIKRAGTGIVKPEAVNKGAYAIRLTE